MFNNLKDQKYLVESTCHQKLQKNRVKPVK